MSGLLIIGAGQAGGELAVRLRQQGFAAPILLIGGEPHLPYQRPPLSKAFLEGRVDEDALLLRTAETYAAFGIEIRLATWVTAIDRAARTVRTEAGASIGYDTLVLATGGQARKLACPGANLAGVFSLRGIDDVRAIRAAFTPGRRLVLIGGGYVGLEVAAVAVKAGLTVTVVEAAPRLLARVTGPDISRFYAQAHRETGVEIHTSATVVALREGAAGQLGAVELADGSRIEADLAIAGIGLIPHTALAEAAGLAVQDGIEVDAHCVTSDPAILAIGDCANFPSAYAERRLRLESVPNALEQARVAAATVMGEPSAYAAIPWFWSDQYDLKLQAVGLVRPGDACVIRGDPARRAFSAFYLRDSRLIAADCVNKPADFMAAKRLVTAGATPDPVLLADEGVSMKSLLG